MKKPNLLIIGNGMAGLRFLEEWKSSGSSDYQVTIIGAEPDPAYNRVLLSSVLAEEISAEDASMKPRAWYEENGWQLRTNARVTQISPGQSHVLIEGGEILSYDILVLATGSTPFVLPVPGNDLKGVYTFRTLGDVDVLGRNAKGSKAVVIGGGLLGLETAYGLQKRGASVSLIHVTDRLMNRQLDAEAAAILKRRIEGQGIEVLLDAQTECLLGDEHCTGVRLSDGRIIGADFVVMAVGILPEKSLGEEAGLDCGRGIKVNDQLQTSSPDIYALGECAEHRGQCYGLVEPLYAQAKILASRLTGDLTASYSGSVTSTNLKVSGVEVFSAGDYEDLEGSEKLIYRDPSQSVYRKLQILRASDGTQHLAGAVLIGDSEDGVWYAELINNKTPVENIRSTLMFGRQISELAA